MDFFNPFGVITPQAATCTVTAKAGGDTVQLKVAPMGGTANYSVKYQKKLGTGLPIDIPGASFSNLIESTAPTDYKGLFTYTVTDADVIAANVADPAAVPPLAAGRIRFIAAVTDSCPNPGPKTDTEICDVATTCGVPDGNFTTV